MYTRAPTIRRVFLPFFTTLSLSLSLFRVSYDDFSWYIEHLLSLTEDKNFDESRKEEEEEEEETPGRGLFQNKEESWFHNTRQLFILWSKNRN